jgi:ST7 protein
MRGLAAQMFGAADAAFGPLDQAQDLMYQAFKVADAHERVNLAKKALEISGDCADAYVVLAENAPSLNAAFEYYQKGVAAGERALGPLVFQEQAGHFWGLLETRPYMRAREGLAHVLWRMARQEEAVSHLEELLRLNPNDNQGVRDALASWLLCLDRDEELARLLARYDDPTATWAYSQALLAFRRQGDTPESRRLLQAAEQRNPFVPKFLSGEEPIPERRPSYYSLGDRDEAIFYAAAAMKAWRSTTGAITWVRYVLRHAAMEATEGRPFGPSAFSKARLKRLPNSDDVWQMGCRPLSKRVESDVARLIPWVILVASRAGDVLIEAKIATEEPTSDRLWDILAKAMMRPANGEPRRPAQIQVRPDPRWDEIGPHLNEIGIERQTTDNLDLLDALLDDLNQHLTSDGPPGLLDIPRVTPEIVAGLFKAAAEFHRQAPWRTMGDQNAIKVECERFQSGPWYAAVMGQSGITVGLALYEDLRVLRKLWNRVSPDHEECIRQAVALTVTFDPENDAHPKNLEAARRHGWEVANPEAFPTVFRKERGLTIRPPLSWELALLEGCLRAIPEFIACHEPADTTKQPLTVRVAAGKLNLVLSWVEQH